MVLPLAKCHRTAYLHHHCQLMITTSIMNFLWSLVIFLFPLTAFLAIDYLSMTLTVCINNKSPKIHIYTNDYLENSLIIPPKCEIFQSFVFKNSHKVDQCVEQQELMTGVFVARCIEPCDKPMIRLLLGHVKHSLFELCTKYNNAGGVPPVHNPKHEQSGPHNQPPTKRSTETRAQQASAVDAGPHINVHQSTQNRG